jgi:ABC-type multidrug transport system ATPase subunit
MADVIVASGLTRHYGRVVAIDNVDLRIAGSEFVGVAGPNGAGKSSLLKLLSSTIRPSAGEVLINGISLTGDATQAKRQIGVLSHESYLYEDLDAIENLHFFGRMYDMEKQHLNDRTKQLLKEAGLWKRATEKVGTYSRGMKQRLSFARTLLHEPSVLFLDEPYTGLDAGAGRIMDRLLAGSPATTGVVVSHDIEHLISLCSRILVMESGRIVYDGTGEAARDVYNEICGGSRL